MQIPSHSSGGRRPRNKVVAVACHQRSQVEQMESRVLMSYTPAGPDALVNQTTAGSQTTGTFRQNVAADADGNFVATWSHSNDPNNSDTDVYARRYNADGSPRGGEFRVNTTTAGRQAYHSVGVKANGEFTVVWQMSYTDQRSTYQGVFAQRYNADGTRNGTEVRLSDTSAESPALAMDAQGNFVVTWQTADPAPTSKKAPSNGWGIRARRFNGSGQALGPSFIVNTELANNQHTPQVAMNPAGTSFAVVWQSQYQDGSGWGIYGKRFAVNPDGTATAGAEFRANTTTAGDQFNGFIGMGPSGQFTVGWAHGAALSAEAGVAQRFNADGSRMGGEFVIGGDMPGIQHGKQVAYDESGTSLLLFSSPAASSTDRDLCAQAYDAAGQTDGGAFVVNSTVEGHQYAGQVAFQPGGHFISLFMGPDAGGSTDVYLRRFLRDAPAASEPAAATSTSVFGDTAVAEEEDDANLAEQLVA